MQWLIQILVNRGNDLSTFFVPNAYFFKRFILENHSIPLWNPIQFSGFPYLADPQNYIFYLPNYIFVFLNIETAFTFLLLGHLILAAAGTYLLARKTFKLEKFPSLFSASIFTFTPLIISHLEAGHYTMINAFAWLPWFFLLMFKLVQKPTVKTALFLAVISSLIYINYINIAYFTLLFFSSYSIFYLLVNKNNYPFKSFFIHSFLFIILFFGLISPVLIAQLQIAPDTTRSLLTFTDIAQPVWSFKLFLQNLLFPLNLNHQQFSTERVLYPGLINLFLAATGFVYQKAKQKRFFAIWIIFSLLFALGSRIPLFYILYKFLPGISYLRVTTRMWVLSLLLISIYAGLGLKRLKVFRVVLAITALVEITIINRQIFSRPIQVDQTPTSFYQYILNDSQKGFRVYCTTGCFSLQKLGELGINSLAGNNPVQLTESTEKIAAAAGYQYHGYIPILPPYPVFSQQPQPNSQLMAELNTKYIASPYLLIDSGFKLIYTLNGYHLYINSKF